VATPATGRRTRRRAVSEADKDRRRERILSAAKKVFARKGFHATTMADVARAARLSYGSTYWYFDSKEALFSALLASEESALRAHVYEALLGASWDGYEEPVRAAVRAALEYFDNDRGSARLLFRDAYGLGGSFERQLHGMFERFIGDIEAMITGAQERGLIVQAPPGLIAFSAAALIGQVAHRRLTTDDGVDARTAADFVVGLLLDGLRPR
jgi:AcrR family transcriptional regulator